MTIQLLNVSLNVSKNKSNNSSNASTIPPPTMMENTIPDFDSPVQFSNDQKITEKVKGPKRSQFLKRKLNKSIFPQKKGYWIKVFEGEKALV